MHMFRHVLFGLVLAGMLPDMVQTAHAQQQPAGRQAARPQVRV
jgi:hypothetical protein